MRINIIKTEYHIETASHFYTNTHLMEYCPDKLGKFGLSNVLHLVLRQGLLLMKSGVTLIQSKP